MNRKILMSICLLFVTNLVVAKHKVMLGRLEMVKIQPGDLEIEAKMDTGAYQTSLHAEGIEEHMFKGKRYVIFKFPQKG